MATVTGTPPTATNTRTPTRTRTPINTATPTPTPGCNDWRYVSSPTSGQQTNTLYGVSAASPDDIWAVGNKGQYSSVNLSVMVQHWDGVEWTLLPVTNPGSLRAVDVISSNDVWAVGYTYDPPVQTMIMHWDGAAWNVIPSPNIPGTANKLYAVDAAGPNDVWAVGEANDQLLVLHWDGVAWSIVPTPQIDLEYSLLNAVAVAGPNDVWAVGTYGNYDAFTLTLHWDGTAWTRSVSPNPGSYRNSLQAVSVVSSNDIWAAGWSSNGNSTFSPTILHWDGTAWTESLITLADSPSTFRSPQLFGISAVSSTEAYAVGWAWDSSIQVDIILVWNGTTWTRANPPRISGYYNHLYAVTTVGAGEAWAVGILGNHSSIYVPQILHYGPPCGTPTATVTGTPPTSTPTACGVVNGALTAGDTTLTSHLYRLFPPSTCDAPQPYQGTSGAGGSYYYDTYTYPNTTGASTCVSILLNPMTCSGTGGTFIHASAYLNTFDPTNLETNYLGDIGNSPTGPTTFSVTAPAGQSVVVVVNAVVSGPSGACPGYQLTINGHGGCPTPTPGTPTATPTCRPNEWTTAAPIPGPRMGAAVAAVGGFLYEAGGDVTAQGGEGPGSGTSPNAGNTGKSDSSDVRTAAASRYDGTSWAPIANMPVAVMDGAGVSDGTYFYVIGGSSDTTSVTNTQRYNPSSNTWTARAPLPQAAAGAASIFYNGRIYLFGGCNDSNCSVRLDTVQIYDPATDTWSTGADVPTNVTFGTAEVIGSYIYLAGGLGSPGETKAYRYDPLTSTWDDAAMADLSDSLWGAASGVLNGKMYVFGGIVNNTSGASKRTLRYDPVTNTWTTDANLNTATFRMQGDSYNNSLYVVGGSMWGSYTARVERYTINAGCATPTPGTPTTTPIPSTSTAILPTGTPGLPTGTAASVTETPVAQTSTPTLPTNTALPVTPTPIACAGLTITGSLTLNDPTQAGRLNTLLDASSCENPRDCPGAIDDIV
ncbi:MAG TPA: kelch repeat-containing protein, partial [Chloroflexia bacterium]|nr:kelch repeat-containing protein [Chloroflexia bacterium]